MAHLPHGTVPSRHRSPTARLSHSTAPSWHQLPQGISSIKAHSTAPSWHRYFLTAQLPYGTATFSRHSSLVAPQLSYGTAPSCRHNLLTAQLPHSAATFSWHRNSLTTQLPRGTAPSWHSFLMTQFPRDITTFSLRQSRPDNQVRDKDFLYGIATFSLPLVQTDPWWRQFHGTANLSLPLVWTDSWQRHFHGTAIFSLLPVQAKPPSFDLPNGAQQPSHCHQFRPDNPAS